MADFDQFVQGWNLNKGYYDHINEVIVGTDIAYHKDDPFQWFKFLRMIYRKIHRRLKASSLEEIDKLFLEITQLLNWSDLGQDVESHSLKINRTKEALDKLDQLEIRILDEMHDEDMLPTKTERTSPDRAVEDFGYG